MACRLTALYIVAFTLTFSSPAQENTTSLNTTIKHLREQVKEMQRDAHTPEQYNVVAGIYTKLQEAYQQKAEEERQLMVNRSANTTSTSAKYPRPVDSAQYLFDYYSQQADAMRIHSERYARKARSAPMTDPR